MKAKFFKSLYFNSATGFSVALYKTLSPCIFPDGSKSQYIKISGQNLPERKGVTYTFSGSWQKDRKGGKGKYLFLADGFEDVIPTEGAGIVKYLQTLDGIGKKTAVRIYEHFGDDVFNVLDTQPQRLLEVKGLRKKTADRIHTYWLKNSKGKNLFAYLYGFRIPDSAIREIYETYEEFALDIVRSEPYSLMDFSGIGFKAADAVARDNGFGLASRPRIIAAMTEAIRSVENAGSTCAVWSMLYEETTKLLRSGLSEEEQTAYYDEIGTLTEKAPFEVILFKLAQTQARREGSPLVIEEADGELFYYRKITHQREKAVASNVRRLLRTPSSTHVSKEKLTEILEDAIRKGALEARLSPQQTQAVLMALNENISIITGGPGTGKTFVQKAVLYAWQKLKGDITPLLLAPTGRAAKRMSESTGYPARTIHSALGLFETDENIRVKAHLDCDLLIVDEASMLDNTIASILFSSIGKGTKVILVGDDKQLPSVGAGAVLRELLSSGELPTVSLTSVFRQAEGSSIRYNAARMQRGQTEMLEDESFAFVEVAGTEEISKEVCAQYEKFTAKYPLSEVAVLSPYRRSTQTGTDALNKALQKVVFPDRDSADGFLEGDKVMFTKNMNGLTNGDIGVVESVTKDEDGKLVNVQFGEETAALDEKDVAHLELAYATTIHKSQGSEYKAVLLVMDPAHAYMHTLEIIYTAATRAKEVCLVLGSRASFTNAISNVRITDRKSLLAHFLKPQKIDRFSEASASKNSEESNEKEEQISFEMN